MSDQDKLGILRIISEDAVPGKTVRFSFSTISKTTGLTKDKLDLLLTELNKDRSVVLYSKKGVDSFIVEIKQKGLDAVEDAS